MDVHVLHALIIGSSAALLIIGWLVLCFYLWRTSSKRRPMPLVALFALSSGMSFAWFFAALIVYFVFLGETGGGCAGETGGCIESTVFDWTFGLTGTLFRPLLNLFPQNQNPDDVVYNLLVLLNIILPFFTIIAIFFLLSLLPALVTRRTERQAKKSVLR